MRFQLVLILCGPPLWLAASAAADDAVRSPPVVEGIAAAKAVPLDAIDRGVAIGVRGTVTYASDWTVAIQENGRGLWADLRGVGSSLALDDLVGAELKITGRLDRGAYAPLLLADSARVIGRASLPPPAAADPQRLYSGADNGARVVVEGIVQGYREDQDKGLWNLVVDSGSRRFVTRIAKPLLAGSPATLVDAEVRIVGVVGALRNTKGEFLRPALCVSRSEDLAVLKQPRFPAFEAPLVPLGEIARFRPEPDPGHRIRTAGVATIVVPGRFIYLQEGLDGLRVDTRSTPPLQPGDRVEASGFVYIRRNLATVTEAEIRVLSSGQQPPPIPVEPDDVLAVNMRARENGKTARPGTYHGCLIRCSGALVEATPPLRDRCRLIVSSGASLLTASLPAGDFASVRRIAPGTSLLLTGVVELGLDADDETPLVGDPLPDHVDLLLRSAADVTVVAAPSWWTVRRLATALASMAALLAAAVGWVMMLRRRVALQAATLATETRARHDEAIEHHAALRERSRLAANLHDTVLQTVTGVGFQLKVCKAAADRGRETAQPVEVAQRMVDHAIQQLRGTVWALHAIPLEGQSLVEAIESLAERLGDEQSATIVVRGAGPLEAVPEAMAGSVLLVAQEAIRNALAHARCSRVDVETVVEGDRLWLRVRDDGVGFIPGEQPGASRGHFGLEGMRDRVQQLGGTLTVRSAPGIGTSIEAYVPLETFPQALSDRSVPPAAAKMSIVTTAEKSLHGP